ncbi:DUF4230 domain-containing protein [Heliobacillus mobilis]|uniref:DUF4230 domain-containing protein n=1 Tax=Heliobacterium mobile TaxID=28064 RepID=A0A6I3SPQ7_HELMO|nr:DUF4230 domain-containing protein [Heliobacterium mobile]MTV51011.1 DUF4230 domain-containing protein [Heliobacterium mobile]
MNKNAKYIFVILSIVGAFVLGRMIFELPFPPDAAVPRVNTATENSLIVNITQLREVANLVTYEYTGQAMINFKDHKRLDAYGFSFDLPFTDRQYVAVGQAKVAAGIDANKMDVKEVQGKKVTIAIPKATIRYKECLPDTWEVLVDKRSIRKLSRDEIHKLENDALVDFTNTAMEQGILDKAEEKAKETIEKMLKEAGATEVSFILLP